MRLKRILSMVILLSILLTLFPIDSSANVQESTRIDNANELKPYDDVSEKQPSLHKL